MRSVKLIGVVAATVIFSLFCNVSVACPSNKHCKCSSHKCHCSKGARKCKCGKNNPHASKHANPQSHQDAPEAN